METLTRKIASFATGIRYEHIPQDVVACARRFLFDTIGCALGGLKCEDPRIYKTVLHFLGGNEQATVMGTRERSSLVHAAFLNSLLVRVMDYNDIYWNQDPSHPSDLIPVALALGEYLKLDGKKILTAIVLAYEIEMRLCDFAFPGIRERGWHHATLTQIASPFIAGKLLGLNEEQMVNAAGISGSCHCTLGAVTAGKLTMMKNTVDPIAAASGIEAALLAREGYTGPEHVLDGKEGLMEVLGEKWVPESLVPLADGRFKILRCGMKAYPTEALTHSPITALLNILKRHTVDPADITSVTVKTISRAADILSDPSKYNPTSKETADHSLPYCLAAALGRGRVTPAEFEEDTIMDESIRRFLPLIRVEADPAYEALFPEKQPCRLIMETKSGSSYEEYVEHPRGHPDVPMDDEELIGKFTALASPEMSPERVMEIYRLVSHFDELDSPGPLLELIVID